MFIYKEFTNEPDKIFIVETQMDEIRKCATLKVLYRFGITNELNIWKCFELERREIIEVEENFDIILDGLYKEYGVDFTTHKINLEKVASYTNKAIVVK